MKIQDEINDQSAMPAGNETLSRRGLLRNAGLLAGGVLAGGSMLRATTARAEGAGVDTTVGDGTAATMSTASGGPVPGLAKAGQRKASPQRVVNDLAILNSALLLEYLEAEFYTRVVQADMQRAYLSEPVRQAALTLQRDEITHVQAISAMIQQLGGTPIAKPGFQFPGAIFISPLAFLSLSASLEETGVSTYLGAAPKVQLKDVLKFAASIYGIETRHAGLIHYLQGELLAPHDMEMPITIEEALARANPYIVKDQVTPNGMVGGAGF